jgi:hypothetical protein
VVRDPNGRFVKGVGGGGKSPGRPKRATEEKLFEQFKRGITVEDIDAIRAALVKRASRGDTGAAKLIFEYLFGPPKQQVELSGSGGGPIEIRTVEVVKPADDGE